MDENPYQPPESRDGGSAAEPQAKNKFADWRKVALYLLAMLVIGLILEFLNRLGILSL
jgi:hypothetical protein